LPVIALSFPEYSAVQTGATELSALCESSISLSLT
jgi:hypothetical protein